MSQQVVRMGDRNNLMQAVTSIPQTKFKLDGVLVAVTTSDVAGGAKTGAGVSKFKINGKTVNIVTNVDTNGGIRIEGYSKFLIG